MILSKTLSPAFIKDSRNEVSPNVLEEEDEQEIEGIASGSSKRRSKVCGQ